MESESCYEIARANVSSLRDVCYERGAERHAQQANSSNRTFASIIFSPARLPQGGFHGRP
jgi:hypothetical protein